MLHVCYASEIWVSNFKPVAHHKIEKCPMQPHFRFNYTEKYNLDINITHIGSSPVVGH